MLSFQYPVTRDITLRHFTPVLLILGFIWILLVTLINVAVNGYENVSVTSTNFTTTTRIWYQKFIPKAWVVPAWNCEPGYISLNDGIYKLQMVWLIEAMTPYTSLFDGYNLNWFSDPRSNVTVDRMQYADYSLGNCSVQSLQIGQWASSASIGQV